MNKYSKKIQKALITYDIELVEIMSGVASLSWGLWLLNPIFNTFVSAPTFNTMSSIAPEWLWGFAMFVIGIIQIESVLSHSLRRRKLSSIILATMWIFITSVFAHANISSTGVVIYGTFAIFTVWSYLRLSQRVEIKSRYKNKET